MSTSARPLTALVALCLHVLTLSGRATSSDYSHRSPLDVSFIFNDLSKELGGFAGPQASQSSQSSGKAGDYGYQQAGQAPHSGLSSHSSQSSGGQAGDYGYPQAGQGPHSGPSSHSSQSSGGQAGNYGNYQPAAQAPKSGSSSSSSSSSSGSNHPAPLKAVFFANSAGDSAYNLHQQNGGRSRDDAPAKVSTVYTHNNLGDAALSQRRGNAAPVGGASYQQGSTSSSAYPGHVSGGGPSASSKRQDDLSGFGQNIGNDRYPIDIPAKQGPPAQYFDDGGLDKYQVRPRQILPSPYHGNDVPYHPQNPNKNSDNSFGNAGNSGSYGNAGNSGSYGNDANSGSYGNGVNSGSYGNAGNSGSHGNDGNSRSYGNAGNSGSYGNDVNSGSYGNGVNSGSYGNAGNSGSHGSNGNIDSYGTNGNSGSYGNDVNSGSYGNNNDNSGSSFGASFLNNDLGVKNPAEANLNSFLSSQSHPSLKSPSHNSPGGSPSANYAPKGKVSMDMAKSFSDSLFTANSKTDPFQSTNNDHDANNFFVSDGGHSTNGYSTSGSDSGGNSVHGSSASKGQPQQPNVFHQSGSSSGSIAGPTGYVQPHVVSGSNGYIRQTDTGSKVYVHPQPGAGSNGFVQPQPAAGSNGYVQPQPGAGAGYVQPNGYNAQHQPGAGAGYVQPNGYNAQHQPGAGAGYVQPNGYNAQHQPGAGAGYVQPNGYNAQPQPGAGAGYVQPNGYNAQAQPGVGPSAGGQYGGASNPSAAGRGLSAVLVGPGRPQGGSGQSGSTGQNAYHPTDVYQYRKEMQCWPQFFMEYEHDFSGAVWQDVKGEVKVLQGRAVFGGYGFLAVPFFACNDLLPRYSMIFVIKPTYNTGGVSQAVVGNSVFSGKSSLLVSLSGYTLTLVVRQRAPGLQPQQLLDQCHSSHTQAVNTYSQGSGSHGQNAVSYPADTSGHSDIVVLNLTIHGEVTVTIAQENDWVTFSAGDQHVTKAGRLPTLTNEALYVGAGADPRGGNALAHYTGTFDSFLFEKCP